MTDDRPSRRRVRSADPGTQPDRGRTPNRGTTETDPEGGLRGLVAPGPTQVGVTAAMRARDASRPTEDDLAAAERDVVIVRRHWQPPA